MGGPEAIISYQAHNSMSGPVRTIRHHVPPVYETWSWSGPRDTIQLENTVSTISQEYLLEFTSEYGIPEGLHPELPGPEDTIVDFSEGKVGMYTKVFEFANFRIPISQFLFDILGYYQIHISQLSVIGAAKVSHFEIACRILNIAPTLALFHVFYVPSYNSGWMSFIKRPGKNTPQCYTKPLDSLKNWNNRFFWVDEIVFLTVVDWRVSTPKDEMPTVDSYLAANVTMLITRRTPIQKQPEALLCLVGLSRHYLLGDDEYPTFLYEDGQEMDLINLISAPNPSKVKTGIRPRAAHEVPLLTVTANRVIEMKDPSVASGSSGTPSTVERSFLDFDNENPASAVTEGTVAEGGTQDELAHEEPPEETVATTEVAKEAVFGEEMASVEPLSTTGGKSLASMGLEAGIPIPTPTPQEIPADVSDPDPLSYSKPQSVPEQDIAQSSKGASVAGDPESEKSSSFTSIIGSPGGIYQPGWGVTNSCRLDTSDACQDVVDHIVPPGYFSELRHLPNDDFLSQYNINLARQVAMGSQLRLRFEQEVRLRKRAMEKIAKREQRIQAREEEIKRLDAEVKSLKVVETEVHGLRNQAQNLKTLLEAEVDMKKATEARNEDLAKEVESLHAKFADLQVNNSQLSQQVSTLQAQVTGEEKIKAAFEEFKRLEDEKGMSEGLKYGVEHGGAKLDLAALEAYDPEAEGKYIAALTALRDMKYPLVDQLEQLKDAPIDLLMASLHLESDTGEDAPPFIRDLRPSSSQLKIPVYPEVRDPKNPWAVKEEMLLEDAVAANISRAEKKRKCRIVCRTHGVGSAHHARSDGVPVSVPTVIPQGLQILLEDAATQTELSEDEASPKLIRSKSLPSMYNLNWP
ncbi:hypothetical protein Tco_0910530 [Tanacetum coccineum]|uniref:Transposase (putative) gypsy type domain-containing protein n=1 Tax=Tanacetum coccineum TaxID=301880 RepID=A0ABQ5CT54_9ASTR